MTKKRQLEYFLLRYVPEVVKGEFVNFGVIIIEAGGDGFAEVRFARDWGRVQRLDPQVDLDWLAAMERDIREQLVDKQDREALLRKMQDSFSNLIQLTSIKRCVSDDPLREIELMATIYLESSKVVGERVPSGRQRILVKMQEAFEQAGVGKFVLPVPSAQYTKIGDPFQFDFGYKVGEEMKLFHAVSLKTSVDAAIMLAARYPRIAPIMSKMTETELRLTAVIDDDLDRSQESVQFALNMMEEERIRIAVSAEMPMIAEVARRELRV